MAVYDSMVGQQYGRLTAIESFKKDGKPFLRCVCVCGTEKDIYAPSLKRGIVKSCGCFRKEFRRNNLVGQRFGRLTVLSIDENKHNHPGMFYVCRCDCGKEIVVRSDGLTSGHAKGCGCVNKRRETHGQTHTKLYKVWTSIKQRCENHSNTAYANYGGRGVYICSEWANSFDSFYKWSVGNGYKDHLQIDRIDNDGPYAPWNCRWVDRKVNMNNRRCTPHIEYNGETHTIPEWSRLLNIDESVMRKKYHHGYSLAEIIECEKGRKDIEPYL